MLSTLSSRRRFLATKSLSPADLLQPEFETMKKEAAEWTEQEEDILTYAMFPKVAPKFFKDRRDRKYGVDGKHSDAENKVHPV